MQWRNGHGQWTRWFSLIRMYPVQNYSDDWMIVQLVKNKAGNNRKETFLYRKQMILCYSNMKRILLFYLSESEYMTKV